MNGRELCFRLLLRQQKDNAYSNLLLDSELNKAALEPKERAFATACFYGVLEKRITIDYQLSLYLKQPLKKLRPEVLSVLRLGAYQILFMEKVPASAAINESVKLIKKNRCAFAAGLVNAVLRRVSENGLVLPEKTHKDYLSVKYSVPEHIIDLWTADYGEDTCAAVLEGFSEKAPTVIRVNTALTNTSDLIETLSVEGVTAKENPLLAHSLVLENAGAIEKLRAFREGLFHVEDTAAQMAALAVEAQEGERILDCCAAPGGKSFTIAQAFQALEVTACDIYEQRVKLIEEGARRLHLSGINAMVQDATVWNPSLGTFERVLCDVPCSGLGIIRSKPEIRYKSLEEIKASSALQKQILTNAFRYVKPGGTLVYSTCTLRKAENEEVIESFLGEHPGAELLFEKTFFPHTDKTDGFFVAKLKKHE